MRKAFLSIWFALVFCAMLGLLGYPAHLNQAAGKISSDAPQLKKEQRTSVVAQLPDAPVFTFQVHPVTKAFGFSKTVPRDTWLTVACRTLLLHNHRQITHQSQSFIRLLFPFHDFG